MAEGFRGGWFSSKESNVDTALILKTNFLKQGKLYLKDEATSYKLLMKNQ